MLTDWIIAAFTVIIAALTFLILRVYLQMEWLSGAMETHSDLMLRIEARRGIHNEPIKLLWWDPTIAKPPRQIAHGQEVDLSTIYIYLPVELRRNNPSAWQKLRRLFTFP
jgi:hypothetical protein